MKQGIKILLTAAFALAAVTELAKARPAEAQTQIVTAGQKFKNIKVFNDLPADQLGQVMNVMAASLGADCKTCHVSNEKDFEKDGIDNKETARQMVKMTIELNKGHFEGRPEISCNTCHNGKERPNAVPSLYPPAPMEMPKQPSVKPSNDQILEKYVASLGGREALAKVTSRRITATRIERDGKTTEPEEIWQKGQKSLMTTKYGGYAITEGFDGSTAWKRSNSDLITLRPDEAEQIKRDAMIFANPDLKVLYSRMDFRYVDRIDGRDVNFVLAVTPGGQRERLYFDISTGSLVRRIAVTQTMIGPFQYQVDYMDFKDFGGVRLPSTIKFAIPNVRWTRKIIEIKNNPGVEDAKFKG